MKNNISFGTINVKTGERTEGFIENGEMKYKKIPWWKRIFRESPKPPEQTEYIGTTQLYSKLIWSNNKNYFNAAVYKRFNPFTKEIYEIYSNTRWGKFNYNIDAFISAGQLIPNE